MFIAIPFVKPIIIATTVVVFVELFHLMMIKDHFLVPEQLQDFIYPISSLIKPQVSLLEINQLFYFN